jgi:hypothetical protein
MRAEIRAKPEESQPSFSPSFHGASCLAGHHRKWQSLHRICSPVRLMVGAVLRILVMMLPMLLEACDGVGWRVSLTA